MNNGRNTTDGLAYNHLTRCLASCGDGTVVWSHGPQADTLIRHRDRYSAPERNFGLTESGPTGVRIEASARVCAVDPRELDHLYH